MADHQYLQQLARRLADEGKLIEAGWVGLRLAVVPPNASAVQLQQMRTAFMAGAHHLFYSMTNMLDPGVRETAGDLRRVEALHQELEAFGKELKLRVQHAEGSG